MLSLIKTVGVKSRTITHTPQIIKLSRVGGSIYVLQLSVLYAYCQVGPN
jgi:hypothetical protein